MTLRNWGLCDGRALPQAQLFHHAWAPVRIHSILNARMSRNFSIYPPTKKRVPKHTRAQTGLPIHADKPHKSLSLRE